MALVLFVVPFYAFLTVWASSFVGHYTLLRLWPECVLALLAVWAVVVLIRQKKIRNAIFSSRLAWLVVAYLGLNVLVGCVSLWQGNVSPKALLYGLLLNTRPLIWFGVVWVVAYRASWLRANWQRIVLTPLTIIVAFALIQFFFLPADFLAHFGYKTGVTITPIQTINQDTTTIRAQSFLRGPNALGGYLVAGISVLLFAGVQFWRKAVVGIGALIALLVTFSRSAWVGLLGVFSACVALLWRRRYLKPVSIAAVVIVLVSAGAFYAFRNNDGLQNVVFHVNEHSTATTTSNAGHVSGATDALRDMKREPLGKGPGTAGPASVYNTYSGSRDSESYYLNIGQELGWLGLVLFVWIVLETICRLRGNSSSLARGALAALAGLSVVNIFSYAWTDPTLAYVFWGIAGLAVGSAKDVIRHSSAPNLKRKLQSYCRRLRPSKRGLLQFLYFNLGGVLFFVTGYLIFALLYGALHWYWLIAKGIADLIGWALNYLVQHYLAFSDVAREHGHKKVLKKYVPFSILNVLIDYVIVGGLKFIGVSPFVGLWIASLFFTVWKWLWYKRWVFARAKP